VEPTAWLQRARRRLWEHGRVFEIEAAGLEEAWGAAAKLRIKLPAIGRFTWPRAPGLHRAFNLDDEAGPPLPPG